MAGGLGVVLLLGAVQAVVPKAIRRLEGSPWWLFLGSWLKHTGPC
jgi:hypothetical protein